MPALHPKQKQANAQRIYFEANVLATGVCFATKKQMLMNLIGANMFTTGVYAHFLHT